MKRVIWGVILITGLLTGLLTGLVYASPQRSVIIDPNTEAPVSVVNGQLKVNQQVTLGTTATLRNDINASETIVYKDATWNATVQNLTGYKYVLVENYMNVTGGTYDLTPLFGVTAVSNYTKGQKRTLTGNERFILEVDSESEFNIQLDGKTGSSNITVFVTGFN